MLYGLHTHVVSWVSQVLTTGTSEQAGGTDCTIGLLSSTRLQQSPGTLGNLLGLLGSTCELLGLWTLCIRLQMKFLLYCQVPSLESSPSSFTLEWPFSEVSLLFDLQDLGLVTYAPLSSWWRLVRSQVEDTPKSLLANTVTHPYENAREQAHCEHRQVFS